MHWPPKKTNSPSIPIAALTVHLGHRLHDAKREVIIYDYVDMSVPVLARMAAKRRVGYQTIGYRILGTGDLFSDQTVASEASGEAPATFSV
jgi:hypothetical protein